MTAILLAALLLVSDGECVRWATRTTYVQMPMWVGKTMLLMPMPHTTPVCVEYAPELVEHGPLEIPSLGELQAEGLK